MDQPLHPLPVQETRILDILATLPGTSPSHPLTLNMAGTSGIGYPTEHEMGMPPGGHQLVQNPPYFGHPNAGPPPPFRPSSSHGNNMKGVSNGRHSPPSPPHLVNGIPSSNGPSRGGWVNPGMGMGSFRIVVEMGKEVIEMRRRYMVMMNRIGWWQGTGTKSGLKGRTWNGGTTIGRRNT